MTRLLLFFFISLFPLDIFAELASEMHIEGYTPSNGTVSVSNVSAAAKITETIKNLQSFDQKAKQAWITYFENLSACVTSSAELLQINPILAKQYGEIVTNKIVDVENNKCHVIMMYYSEKDPRLTQAVATMKYPAGQECFLSKETANAITALESDFLEGKEVDVSDHDALSMAMTTECSAFIMMNGKKVIE